MGKASSTAKAGKAIKDATATARAPGSTPSLPAGSPASAKSPPSSNEPTPKAQTAVGTAKTVVHAASGNTAGAVVEGVSTAAGTKTGRRVVGLVVTAVAALTALVVMLPMTYLGATQSDVSSMSRSSVVAAQVAGLDDEKISAANAAVDGTGIPWQVAAALRLVPGDGHGTYGIDEQAAREAHVDPDDDGDVARWLITALGQTGVGDTGDLITGYVKTLDDEGLHDGTMTLADSPPMQDRNQQIVEEWVKAVATLPVAGADEAWARDVVDAAQKLAAGQELCLSAATIPVATDVPTGDATPTGGPDEGDDAATATAPANEKETAGTTTVAQVDGFSETQVKNASTIVAVAAKLGVPRKGAVIALMTALQESRLKNYANSGENRRGYQGFPAPGTRFWLDVARMSLAYPHEAVGNDADSVGVFQQRPSAGWGGAITGDATKIMDNLMSVEYQARAFYGGPTGPLGPGRGLLAVDGWEELPPGVAAQKVQVSAFPDAYAKHEADANRLLDAVGDGAIFGEGGFTSDGCALGGGGGLGGEDAQYDPNALGAWGGHRNGMIPAAAMCPIPWQASQSLRCDATKALGQLNTAYRAQFGANISITDGYRDYATQVSLKASWCARNACHMAATPGTSNHGWGLALDLGGGINQFDTPQHEWMIANSAKTGWVHPPWAKPGKGQEEPWHFEFTGMTSSGNAEE